MRRRIRIGSIPVPDREAAGFHTRERFGNVFIHSVLNINILRENKTKTKRGEEKEEGKKKILLMKWIEMN